MLSSGPLWLSESLTRGSLSPSPRARLVGLLALHQALPTPTTLLFPVSWLCSTCSLELVSTPPFSNPHLYPQFSRIFLVL